MESTNLYIPMQRERDFILKYHEQPYRDTVIFLKYHEHRYRDTILFHDTHLRLEKSDFDKMRSIILEKSVNTLCNIILIYEPKASNPLNN